MGTTPRCTTSRGTATRACGSTSAGRQLGRPATDEYAPQEQADALEVLRWIAAQPWCNGAIGMTGMSWGGFNGLQIAAHAPPELKAVATYFASDDRYADDVHYRGGCVLGMDMLHGRSRCCSFLAQPPAAVGRRRRLERSGSSAGDTEPFGETWLRTSAATPTGSRARCARTTPRSAAP